MKLLVFSLHGTVLAFPNCFDRFPRIYTICKTMLNTIMLIANEIKSDLLVETSTSHRQ